MKTEVARNLPRDTDGIVKPLTKFMPQPALDEHRAKLGLLAEKLSKKHDRFGWDKMPKLIRQEIREDFMDALQDYPLDEVRQAARECEADNPNKMPNEHHIRAKIRENRARQRPQRREPAKPTRHLGVPDKETAAAILEQAGFTPHRMAQAKANPMAMGDSDFVARGDDAMPREAYMTPEEIAREDGQ